ncbi:MAG: hypothetical protein D6832_04910 [Alphaproteobacteria bacterium]|nr:MAG: hypothetical protein D6832_04910 [Alphaproteobacteria bacterium]
MMIEQRRTTPAPRRIKASAARGARPAAALAGLWMALAAAVLLLILASGARAQEYVQLAARSDIPTARALARSYAERYEGVQVFSLPTGWYAIAVGPFASPAEAERFLRSQKRRRLIPRDAFLARASDFGRRVWPAGLEAPAGSGLEIREPDRADAPAPAAEPALSEPEPEPEMTLAQARRFQARLDRETASDLQRALRWAGTYRGAIDGALGPGSRRAIAAWQQSIGAEPTGYITRRQLERLLGEWRAWRERLGWRIARFPEAGIELGMPERLTRLARTEPPFMVFEPAGEHGMTVVLISQPGDRRRLAALYEVLQSLELVPLEGPRRLRRDSFTIEGRDGERVTRAFARLEKGAIRGLIVSWRPEDDADLARVAAMMRESFRTLGGATLPEPEQPAAAGTDGAALIAGLAVRRPERTASGTWIDARGALIAPAEVVTGCGRITVDAGTEARIEARSEALGLALLRPVEPLAPLATARFATDRLPRPGARLLMAGFSWGDALGAAAAAPARLAGPAAPLGGEALVRIEARAEPGDRGGPVLDRRGAGVAILLGRTTPDGRELPEDVQLAAAAPAVADWLTGLGVAVDLAGPADPELPPRRRATLARDLTAFVACWN